MPIEIRELVIRATVDPMDVGGCGPGSAPSGAGKGPPKPDARSSDDLVQTCIREVLRILEEKRER
jgi:hypothetical protein